MKRLATLILISTSWCIDVAAQDLVNQNTGNIFDHNIVFHNPPGIAYTKGVQGMVGMQWLHAGISGDKLRNSIAYFVYPLGENNAFGMRAIHFSSNLLQQGTFSLLFGHKFFDDRLSLGINANLLYYAYDKDNFRNFDLNDPVIANGTAKSALSFGAGFLFWLSERLACGFSIDDFNQPNIALGKSEFRKDRVYKVGTVYLHPLFSPQIDVQKDGREVSFQPGVHRSFLDKKVDLFAGYHAAGAEGSALLFAISFMPGAWGLSYNIRHELSELGQVSNGSHFLTLHFNKTGSSTVFAKPVIKLNNLEGPVVTIESLIISGEAHSSAGITLVEYRKNGKVVQAHHFDQKLNKAPVWFPIALNEGENEIEVVAYAGEFRSSKTIRVTFAPIVLPPRIALFSSVEAILDTPSYHLHARIDDPRGLQRIRVLVNDGERKNISFTDRPTFKELNEPVFLFEGRNVIEITAANDKAKSTKTAIVTYRPKVVTVAPPEIFILSPEQLRTELRMKTPLSVVRLEWEVKNVESLADVNLKANDDLLILSDNDVMKKGERRFILRKDINLKEGKNRIEVHAHQGGHHQSKEMEVFYNPLLEKRLYRKIWAVIIGINTYRDPSFDPLQYALHDAKGIERILKEQFKVDHFITLYEQQATRDNILATLGDSLRIKTNEDDGVLVFFAGHGATDSTREGDLGYIVPHDGEGDSYSSKISMAQIREISKLIKAKHIFFVIDACFGGTLFITRSGSEVPSTKTNFDSLKTLTLYRARNVLTAGGPTEKVLDGGFENHSIFTGRFLEGLRGNADFNKDSYFTAFEVSDYVQRKVREDARSRNTVQHPLYGKLTADDGEFIFVRKNE